MRASSAVAVLFAVQSSALRILVNNDDSWGSANIRALYKGLVAAGHDAYIVAPSQQQSGKGGTTVFASTANLTGPGEFNLLAAGAPSFGTDPNDSHIWYYNGTPAACTFFALDYVVPKIWNGSQPDLLVSGPNEGQNAGPFLYTLSGTIGATYAAVERGVPAIAFSAGNGTHRPYTDTNGTYDPATLAANAAVKIVNQLASNAKNSSRLLPLGYGINVNLPILNQTCSSPAFVQTRLTGGAIVDSAVFNATSGIFTYGNDLGSGLNACINGDCSLPGETIIANQGCQVSVSVFTTDYDAPNCGGASNVRTLFQPLVAYSNGTSNSTASSTSSAAPLQATTNAAPRSDMGLAGALAFAAAVAALV